jgi:hypothetical protein
MCQYFSITGNWVGGIVTKRLLRTYVLTYMLENDEKWWYNNNDVYLNNRPAKTAQVQDVIHDDE